jgi:protocatechuate 3,4-dioxygenase beta subunit
MPEVGSFAMTTGATGVFAFDGVPPGNYAITAQRNGYVRQDGENRFGPRSTPLLVVTSGQAVTGITIKMVPHGVVAGRVVDEDGEPLARMNVQVQRERWQRGQRQFLPVSSDSTNDLGEYCVAGLPAGRYVVSVTGGGRQFLRTPVSDSADMNYVTTFYPNVIDAAQAAPVAVGSGQETRGVDFQLRKIGTYRIRGRVVDPVGGSGRNLTVMAIPAESAVGMPGRNAAAVRNQDGTFEIKGITPGNYTVIANRANREQGRSMAVQQIAVGNRDVDGLTLTLAPPAEVTGAIRTESDTAVNLGTVRVMLEAMSGIPMFGGSLQATAASGSFKILNVPPGSYRVGAMNLPDGAYLKSVRVGPQEVLESGLQISSTAAPVEIVLGSNAPSAGGTLLDANGRPAPNVTIALVPDIPRRDRYHLYATTATDDAGMFTFRNVTPGDYKIFPLAETEIDVIQNPAFVSQIESRGASVRLTEGKTENLQLAVR